MLVQDEVLEKLDYLQGKHMGQYVPLDYAAIFLEMAVKRCNQYFTSDGYARYREELLYLAAGVIELIMRFDAEQQQAQVAKDLEVNREAKED